jgi:hypothetical protein
VLSASSIIASLFIKFPTGHVSSEEMLSETKGLVMNILLGGYIYIYPLEAITSPNH